MELEAEERETQKPAGLVSTPLPGLSADPASSPAPPPPPPISRVTQGMGLQVTKLKWTCLAQ